MLKVRDIDSGPAVAGPVDPAANGLACLWGGAICKAPFAGAGTNRSGDDLSAMHCQTTHMGEFIAGRAGLTAVGKAGKACAVYGLAVAVDSFDVAAQVREQVVVGGRLVQKHMGSILTFGGTDLDDPASGDNSIGGIGDHRIDREAVGTGNGRGRDDLTGIVNGGVKVGHWAAQNQAT